ncbi:unnamed protein product, partial [Ectocarpus sp. 6 AP-2014]
QGNYDEARRHLERALQIRTNVLGGMGPDTIEIRDTLEFVRDQIEPAEPDVKRPRDPDDALDGTELDGKKQRQRKGGTEPTPSSA